MEDDDDQTVITQIETQVKDDWFETYIDSFGKDRPLDELRELIEQEGDLKTTISRMKRDLVLKTINRLTKMCPTAMMMSQTQTLRGQTAMVHRNLFLLFTHKVYQ